MRICTKYRLLCRIRHHMRRRRQYKNLQVYEQEIYGTELSVHDNLWRKMEWHHRYAVRLRKLLSGK